MKKRSILKAMKAIIATVFLSAGLNTQILAQPAGDHDLYRAARALGIVPNARAIRNFAPSKRLANNVNRAQQKQQRVQPVQARQNQHSNVWRRVYQGFRFRNYNYQPLVRKYISEYSRSPKRIEKLAARSSKYLYMVVNELNHRGMPTELALLPFVESAYRNTAYSHAGAAGMWQFIPATGRRFGLRQTRSYDARLDPQLATRAALDYLHRLSYEFKGDWFLALAAYNVGEFRVHREIARNKARGLRTDFWSLNLPRETKQYVPRLLAFKEIFRNPYAFNVRLEGVPNIPALVSIRVNKAVNLKKVALHAGLPKDTLTSINSGYLHGITTPKYSNKILLPRHNAGRLNFIIQRLPPAADVHNKWAYKSYGGRRYVYHKVKRGDSLYNIARKHGTTVKKIKRLNKLRSNHIKPGKRLKVAKKRSRSYS